MADPHASERWAFPSLLPILLVFVLLNVLAAFVAQLLKLSTVATATYTESALAVVLFVAISKYRMWGEIGFRQPRRLAVWALYLPALALVIGNLTYGISWPHWPMLVQLAVLALASGFVEEVAFRGLLLSALLPRGAWTAILVTTTCFGLAHVLNTLAGFDWPSIVVQIAYSLAVGFGFAAMAVKGRLLMPLVVAHALGNFVAFISASSGPGTGGPFDAHTLIVPGACILLFTLYGLYLMREPSASPKGDFLGELATAPMSSRLPH